MKYLFLLLVAGFSATVFGQKTDTLVVDLENQRQWVIKTYDAEGNVRAIIYQSSRLQDDTTVIDGRRLGDMSAEDLFMRGVLASVKDPRKLRVTDSTYTFFYNGKVDRKTFFRDGATYDYIYDEHWKLQYVEKIDRDRTTYLFLRDQSLVLADLSISLEGRIGDTVAGIFTFSNQSAETLLLRFSSNKDGVILPSSLTLPGGGSGELRPRWLVTKGEEIAVLTVNVAGHSTFELSVDYDGYHLTETDFGGDKKAAPGLELGEVPSLLLRLSSAEKLLKIVNEKGEEVAVLSVPKILNVVPLDQFPRGEYLLTLVDLGSKEEKYCRIKY